MLNQVTPEMPILVLNISLVHLHETSPKSSSGNKLHFSVLIDLLWVSLLLWTLRFVSPFHPLHKTKLLINCYASDCYYTQNSGEVGLRQTRWFPQFFSAQFLNSLTHNNTLIHTTMLSEYWECISVASDSLRHLLLKNSNKETAA